MQITELIGHPELLSSITLPELRRVVGQCPYYQAARLLLLENLFMLHEPDFDKELRAAALCVPDRSVIFNLVESLNYQIDVTARDAQEEPVESTGDRVNDLIDNYLRQVGHTSLHTGYGPIDPLTDYIATLEQLDDAPGVEDAEDNWPIGFSARETEERAENVAVEAEDAALDAENMTAETENAALDAENVAEENGNSLPNFESADENAEKTAVETDGKTDEETSDFDEENTEDEEAGVNDVNALQEEYFTETLAKVFIKQGNYERAIEILTKINLVNPRKNAYFADQIRFLQKLVVNNKHKK